jgi:FtsP/CotA-like multicopper oxidase with cupredoxin domain
MRAIMPEVGPAGKFPRILRTIARDAYAGEVTRVRAQFNTAGQYVWHCHIVEHEDNEMMRPFRIGPEQSGQPDTHRGSPAQSVV